MDTVGCSVHSVLTGTIVLMYVIVLLICTQNIFISLYQANLTEKPLTIDGATSGTRNLWQHARVWNIWHTGPITNQTKITRNKRNIHSNLNCSVSNSVK